MYIPRNHEKIQTISEVFREEMDKHEQAGGKYYDDTAVHIAGHAIQTLMPELVDMQRSRVIIEANTGISIENDTDTPSFEGIHVEALLERVSIQQVIADIALNPLTRITRYELCAVLRPRYIDPDPQDIVFGNTLVVPFQEVQYFEAA